MNLKSLEQIKSLKLDNMKYFVYSVNKEKPQQ